MQLYQRPVCLCFGLGIIPHVSKTLSAFRICFCFSSYFETPALVLLTKQKYSSSKSTNTFYVEVNTYRELPDF